MDIGEDGGDCQRIFLGGGFKGGEKEAGAGLGSVCASGGRGESGCLCGAKAQNVHFLFQRASMRAAVPALVGSNGWREDIV